MSGTVFRVFLAIATLCSAFGFKLSALPQSQNVSSESPQISPVPIVWVVGGPGAGKGTQCKKIAAKYNFTHLSVGELLRAEVETGSEKGMELQAIMQRGDLVSDEDAIGVLSNAIQHVGPDCKGILVDGFPRAKTQGAAFEEVIRPVDAILYLECTPETMLSRVLKRAEQSAQKRPDDIESIVQNRIRTFLRTTDEILAGYSSQTKRVNGDRSIEQIFSDIEVVVDALLASKSV